MLPDGPSAMPSWTCWRKRASTRAGSSSGTATWSRTPRYHERLARRGAWVQFDTVQGVNEWDTQRRLGWIRALFDAGLEHRLLLSQDVCLTTDLAAYGGPGYAYLLTGFRERLRCEGFPDSTLTMLLEHNPRRALTGE